MRLALKVKMYVALAGLVVRTNENWTFRYYIYFQNVKLATHTEIHGFF